MSNQPRCEKCHSDQIVRDLQVADRTLEEDWMAAPDLKVEVATKPNAVVFKGVVGVPIKASVCGACGYTEFYVSDPGKLVDAVAEQARNSN